MNNDSWTCCYCYARHSIPSGGVTRLKGFDEPSQSILFLSRYADELESKLPPF